MPPNALSGVVLAESLYHFTLFISLTNSRRCGTLGMVWIILMISFWSFKKSFIPFSAAQIFKSLCYTFKIN